MNMNPGGKNLTILGSTGSIGTSTLDVVRSFPERFKVSALAGGRNIGLLAGQIARFRPALAVVLTEELALELKKKLAPNLKVEVLWGEEGYEQAARLDEAETVVSAMVGGAGLKPTLAAVRAGKRVALANKETLVMAGELIMAEARTSEATILPIDSEHSAIFQALSGQNARDVKRIILTASGGPFFGKTREELAEVTRAEALSHPNWKMGDKISIDSATLMNKGLEAIEARWLFDCPFDKIGIQIHPQSVVHSMVEFVDGSVLAQMGVPDMRVPIAYALSCPDRLPLGLPNLDLPSLPGLTFEEPDPKAFPCLALALKAGVQGGTSPVILNAANEVAVHFFLENKIKFLDIGLIVDRIMEEGGSASLKGLDQIIEVDRAARVKTRALISEMKGIPVL